jgi:hypothetical protein
VSPANVGAVLSQARQEDLVKVVMPNATVTTSQTSASGLGGSPPAVQHLDLRQ